MKTCRQSELAIGNMRLEAAAYGLIAKKKKPKCRNLGSRQKKGIKSREERREEQRLEIGE